MYISLLCLKLAIGSEVESREGFSKRNMILMTLKFYSRSWTPHYPLCLSQISICASLFGIHPAVHKSECRQKATLTLTLKTTIELYNPAYLDN